MKYKYRLFTAILMAALFCFSVPALAAGLPQQGDDLSGEIIIIHTNDTHGHVDDNMGFAAASALRQDYEDAGADVLLLDAGDTFHGMPTATLTQGNDIATILNETGYDAATPGNHDFNYGYEHLQQLASMLDFPIISANIRLDGQLMFEENIVIEKGGKKFGIFGLTTPDAAFQTNPEHIEGVTFDDPVEAATAQVALLKRAGVDYIIALTHIGVDHASEYTTDKLAAQVAGIDFIIDGHSHTQMQDGAPVDSSIVLEEHGDTLIASTGAHIENIGVIAIAEGGTATAKIYNSEEYTNADTEVAAIVEEIKAEQSPELLEVVGRTPVDLDGERENVRTKETNLGDLTADALLDATGADLALMNGGNIRATIPQGNITREAVITVFPFGNFILTKEVTGEDIVAALEVGVGGYPDELGGFPQVAGVTFQFDPGQPKGSRVFDVKVNGTDINLDETYVLATNDYLAAGGDEYIMLADAPEISYYSSLEEIFTGYIQNLTDFPAQAQGRITMETMPGAATEAASGQGAAAGAQEYTVQRGDSLWRIAKELLGDGNKWTEIYQLNKDDISHPNEIEIGQTLKLPQAG